MVFEMFEVPFGICFGFMGTFLASRRHETAHDFCSRAGFFDGENDVKVGTPGIDFDVYRSRDLGFEFFPEQHSKGLEAIICSTQEAIVFIC